MESSGFEQANRKLNEIDQVGRKTATSLGGVANKAAGVAQAIAAAGEVGVNAMEKIVRATTNVAFAFGPQGAIVAALGVATLAIVGMFDRARKEMEETTKAANAQLRSIRGMSATSAAEALNFAAGGDPFADTALGRKSVADLQKEANELAAKIAAPAQAGKRGDIGTFLGLAIDRHKLKNDLADINRELALRNDIIARGIPLLQRSAELEARETMARGAGKTTPEGSSAVPQVRGNMPGVSATPGGGQAEANALSLVTGPPIIALTKAQQALLEEMDRLAEDMRASITSVFGDAIVDGFTAAFSGRGIGGVFKALGRSILSGLGAIFMQMGQKMVAASALMIAFQKAIMSFFPGAGLVAGLALMALGGAMMGAGGAMGAGGGGGGAGTGGGNGYYSPREDITRVRLMPGFGSEGSTVTRLNPVVLQATIIGTNDPKAQRELQEMIDRGQRRG